MPLTNSLWGHCIYNM